MVFNNLIHSDFIIIELGWVGRKISIFCSKLSWLEIRELASQIFSPGLLTIPSIWILSLPLEFSSQQKPRILMESQSKIKYGIRLASRDLGLSQMRTIGELLGQLLLLISQSPKHLRMCRSGWDSWRIMLMLESLLCWLEISPIWLKWGKSNLKVLKTMQTRTDWVILRLQLPMEVMWLRLSVSWSKVQMR